MGCMANAHTMSLVTMSFKFVVDAGHAAAAWGMTEWWNDEDDVCHLLDRASDV